MLWTHAMSLGVPDTMFWSLTLREIKELFKRYAEIERQAFLRAALVAAAIINVNRTKGQPLVHPEDLLRTQRKEEDYMDAATSAKVLDSWAASVNADYNPRRRTKRKEAPPA